jgi:hypothetical protein
MTMQVIRIDEGHIQITLTDTERYVISNCMAYLCHGETPHGFHALIGVDVEEAAALLGQLLSIE